MIKAALIRKPSRKSLIKEMSKIPNQTSTQRLKPTPSKTTFSTDSKKCRSLPSCLALITCMHRYKSEPNLIIWLEPVVRRFVRGYHYPLPENAIFPALFSHNRIDPQKRDVNDEISETLDRAITQWQWAPTSHCAYWPHRKSSSLGVWCPRMSRASTTPRHFTMPR